MPEDPAQPPAGFAAVVLAGGTGERLGGVDKATVEVGGATLLQHALAAVGGAVEVVVVGPEHPAPAGVRFVREDPPYGGPAAGLLAGRDALATPAPRWLAVLAVDMPHVTTATWTRLQAAAEGRDGAALVDGSGRRQLAMLLRTDRLDAVRPDRADRLAVHRMLAPLDLADVPAEGAEARDVDAPADLV